MATVDPTSAEAQRGTAEDTLQQKSRDATVISGGHLVAKALKNEGVDTIFTLCGGHIIDIYDGCVDEGIRIIDVRHEQVAAHAADGYARQTGRLGCVVTTAGPGCTNAVTGIATAFRSESPVLHIGGQGALTQHKMGSLQDLPHVDMMTPITKLAATVPSTERVADMVSMAAREAFNGALGIDENVSQLLDVIRIADGLCRRPIVTRLRNHRPGDIDLTIENVTGDFQVHRTRGAVESFTSRHAHHVRNALCARHARCELGDGRHHVNVRQVLQ